MTTEAAPYRGPIQITRSAYVSIPFLGAAFASHESRARGRAFLDTDLDMVEREEVPGITVFSGRWMFEIDPPRNRAASMAWRCMAMPVLLVASFGRALLPL